MDHKNKNENLFNQNFDNLNNIQKENNYCNFLNNQNNFYNLPNFPNYFLLNQNFINDQNSLKSKKIIYFYYR